MSVITKPEIIDDLLSRSVVEVLPSREQLKFLLTNGKQLRIYIGADATGPALHIGHATNYMILEKFRKLGHKVIILVGDFTARIGDPTDKTATRVQLNRDAVLENTKTWLEQIAPIIDIHNKENPVEIVYNHNWLSKMTFEDVINLASNFTVQQMLERDMFEKRLQEKKPIYVHEFFYPLMQGFDSVHLNVDIEICGNDQKFNALTGRTLVQRYKNKEKFVFITTLLENPITKEKMMSKSLGTGVFLNMSARDMFGKIMAQPDENIPQLFIDCTYVDVKEIDSITQQLKNKTVNPRDIKARLAFEITKIYHGEHAARESEKAFTTAFSDKGIPNDVLPVTIPSGTLLSDTLINLSLVASKTEFRRLVDEGAISIVGGEKITDPYTKITQTADYKIGKHRFLRAIV